MTKFYKAVRPNGASFWYETFQWDVTPGGVTTHPDGAGVFEHARNYLSVSTTPTDCTGSYWPCRLFEVEPVPGFPVYTPEPNALPNKRAAGAWRVVRELPAHEVFGPQGVYVQALIERLDAMTPAEAEALAAAAWGAAARAAAWGDAARGDAARAAAWDAARAAAWDTAWDTARAAAWDTAWDTADAARAAADAAAGLLVRDLISTEEYDALTMPVRRVLGPIHPDDPKEV